MSFILIMSDKEMLESLLKDLLVQKEVSEQVSNLHKLITAVSKCNVQNYEKEIYKIIKSHLSSGNLDIQKCALNLLNLYLSETTGSTKGLLYIDITYDIVEIAYNGKTDSVEDQELWLQTFNTISLLDDLFKELCNKKTAQMISILVKSLSPLTTTVQKIKALKMFTKLVSNNNIDKIEPDVEEMLVLAWRNCIFPLTFDLSVIHVHKEALICAHAMLPHIHSHMLRTNEAWEEVAMIIQKEHIPLILRLIEKGDENYCEVCEYLIRLIVHKINKGLPVVNLLLNGIEGAFKSQNLLIRKLAFSCWQVLIESISLDSNTEYTVKRIKLLTIPLKTNNCKTEELTEAKYKAWFTLLRVLISKNACMPLGVVDHFLHFCFGPLWDMPLISYYNITSMSPGKKYLKFYLTNCKALLQIMGVRKYIDDEVYEELQQFPFPGPVLTTEGFLQISKMIAFAVGECSVLLSNEKISHECVARNESVWKSLFYIADTLEMQADKQKVTEQITTIVLALTCLGRKKPNVLEFCVLPVFDIIVSGEFKIFENETMYELIFLPLISTVLKKDKALLRHDLISVFGKIFSFKRNCANFIKFLEPFVKRITITPRGELSKEKLQVLESLWFLLEPELLIFLENAKGTNVDETLYISLYYDFLYWPLASLHRYSSEKLISKWKNMFDMFGHCTTSLLQIKLASMLMRDDVLCIVEKNPATVVLAELITYIVINVNVKDCTEEYFDDVYTIYCGLKNIVSLPGLSVDTLDVYQTSVSHVLESSSTLPYLYRVIQPMTDCLDSILSKHQKTGVLSAVHSFFKSLNYTNNLESSIVSMVDILKSLPRVTVELTRIITTAESVTKIKNLSLIQTKESSIAEQSRRKTGNSSTQQDPEQRISLLGHDVDKIATIKVKDSATTSSSTPKQLKSQTKDDDNFVFVDTPYKFDIKKLTNKQKSKLSRRRDDIPALYQDLSQSQSQILFSNSNSLPGISVPGDKRQKEEVNVTSGGDKDLIESMESDEITEIVQPFAEISKSLHSDRNMEGNSEVSVFENSSPQTTETKPALVTQGRRKPTGFIRKTTNRRNKTIVDYAGLLFPNKRHNPNKILESLEDKGFVSDNEIFRRRLNQKKSSEFASELQKKDVKRKKESLKEPGNGQKERTLNSNSESVLELPKKDLKRKKDIRNGEKERSNSDLASELPKKDLNRKKETCKESGNGEKERIDSVKFLGSNSDLASELPKKDLKRKKEPVKEPGNGEKERIGNVQTLSSNSDSISELPKKDVKRKKEAAKETENVEKERIANVETLCSKSDSASKLPKKDVKQKKETVKEPGNGEKERSGDVETWGSNFDSVPELPKKDLKRKKETAKESGNGEKEQIEIVVTEKLSEGARPFVELSKMVFSGNIGEGSAELNCFENNSLKIIGKKSGLIRRGRRKSTGFINHTTKEQNTTILDYSGTCFSDGDKQRQASMFVESMDDQVANDNDIIRKRVQKELQRIKIDVNYSDEYKNINTKRRTRSDFHTFIQQDIKKSLKSRVSVSLSENAELSLSSGAQDSENPEKKSVEKDIRESGKPLEVMEMETDSEPVIDSSQELEINLKPCKIVALHQFQKIKPGEHMVINDCQSTVDLVVKGPKETSPFKVINQSVAKSNNNIEAPILMSPRRTLFPLSDNAGATDTPKIVEADTRNLEKQSNAAADNVVMYYANNYSFVLKEYDMNDSNCMSHLNIESDSSNVESNTYNQMQQIVNTETDIVDVHPDDTTVSVNSQLLADLDSQPSNRVAEYQNNDNVCRKVMLNTSELSDESVDKVRKNSVLDSPPSNVQSNNIDTSPVCSDTPTRNSEFMRNTEEISPIKDVLSSNSAATLINVDNANKALPNVPARTEPENGVNNKRKEISPVLFSDPSDIGVVDNNKKELNSAPQSFTIRKNKSKYVSSRGAQMMDMVSASTPLGSSASKKKKITMKSSDSKQMCTPQQNRISRMMTQFGKMDNQDSSNEDIVKEQINEDDIFSFSKDLPLPTESPSCSILRKRKQPDNIEEGVSPACKRKRVNFSDPPVTCRKFIEKSAKFKYSVDYKTLDCIPQEPRVTRSSKTDSDESQSVSKSVFTSDLPSEPPPSCYLPSESASKSDLPSESASTSDLLPESASTSDLRSQPTSTSDFPSESASTSDLPSNPINNLFNEHYIDNLFSNFASDANSNEQQSEMTNAALMYNNTFAICEELISCTDLIETIVPNLTTADFVEAITTLLHEANVNIVADLAKLTELQVYELPLKVDKVRKVLTEYSNRSHVETPTKPSRKIKPVSLTSVLLNGNDDIRTESVIIPLAWKDNCGPVLQKPPNNRTDESIVPPNSELLFSEEMCDEIKIEADEMDDSIELSFSPDPDIDIPNTLARSTTPVQHYNIPNTSTRSSTPDEDYDMPNTSAGSNSQVDNAQTNSTLNNSNSMLQNSQSNVIEGIMDEEIAGVKVKTLMTSIINVLNEKKYNPTPLVQQLFGGINNLTNLIVNMGLLKVHHLANWQKWDVIIGEIITNIGIWKLMRYLCKMESIPHGAILESVIKYNLKEIGYELLCDQLNIVELLKYLARNCELSDIMKQYDTGVIYKALLQLCTDPGNDELPIKDVVRDLYLIIITSPINNAPVTNDLTIWQFGDHVISKMDSTDIDKFVQNIYKSVPGYGCLNVQRQQQQEVSRISNGNSNDDDMSVVQRVKAGGFPDNVRTLLLEALTENMSAPDLMDFFSKEMKKKL